MNKFLCYIKSHVDMPDFEVTVSAKSLAEAVDQIHKAQPNLSTDIIIRNIIELSNCCEAPVFENGICSECKEHTR